MTEQKRTRSEHKKMLAQKNAKTKTKTPAAKWVKRVFMTLVLLFVIGFVGGLGVFAFYASTAPKLDEELLKDPLSSEFYDKDGELFATIGVQNRQYVKYEDIPQEMIDAILATEDVRFFEHGGMDFYRLGGAVLANFREGFGAQGASTITQQVVKNSFLSTEKKLKRKAQEAWLAFQLERKYEKEEIFEMYFNKVLMSGRIYGFGTASKYFYGKELKDLTLDETALLAGMPQLPNGYNPLKYPEAAEKRRNIVLTLMEKHGKIDASQMEQAQQADVTAGLSTEEQRKSFASTKYDSFLDVVLSEIEENGDGDSLAEGIKVYTTLDSSAQEIVESIMNNDANFPTETIESGVAVVDTKTGEIRAIGGGRNYGAERGWNYAEDSARAPGSTIKPLLDYGPAIENLKWSTGHTTVDDRTTYTNSKQVISNWDGKYLGKMTIREALYTSRNVPAVKTLNEAGLDNAKDFIKKLGVETKSVYESDAIGGGNISMTPIQMAASYAAFGNKGVYTDSYSVTKIVYRDGKTTKSYKQRPVVAMSDYTAYMITDILRDVVSNKPNASASAAIISGLDVAGKTGTTNYGADEFEKYNLPSTSVPDSWFAGYTTNYSIAIWSGYKDHKDPITTWEERRLPQKLFKNIMSQLSSSIDTPRFKQPSSVVEATIEVGTKPLKLASKFTPSNLKATELFVRGTEPKQVSEEYEQVKLSAPFNVNANYNDGQKSVDISWEHTPPVQDEDEEPLAITYEVQMKVDDGANAVITTTDKKNFTLPNVQSGNKFTFSIVAIHKDVRSEPGTVTIHIENNEAEPEEPDVPDYTQPNPPGNGNGNGNGNGDGDGNGNGNGGATPPVQPTPPGTPEEEDEDEEDNP